MKITNPLRAGIALLLLLLFFNGCKKDIAKRLSGVYIGTATQKNRKHESDPFTITNFSQCKIVITEIDHKKIKLIIIPDPVNNPSDQRPYDIPVTHNNTFELSGGSRLVYSAYVKGSRHGDQLDLQSVYSESSGGQYNEFTFNGRRD